jgi:hypothetical protein
LGGTPEGGIPETRENIRARVVDRTGTATELTRVSLDGSTFFEGYRGSGKVTIPFGEIQSIVFADRAQEEALADLRLKSGQELRLTVRRRAILYGDAGYGAFQIRVRDIRQIDFL